MSWRVIFLFFLIFSFVFQSTGFAFAQEGSEPAHLPRLATASEEASTSSEEGPTAGLRPSSAMISRIVKPIDALISKISQNFPVVWKTVLGGANTFFAFAGKIAGQALEERKDIIKQEFKKEIDEMKGDIAKLTKFTWEQFKQWIKK